MRPHYEFVLTCALVRSVVCSIYFHREVDSITGQLTYHNKYQRKSGTLQGTVIGTFTGYRRTRLPVSWALSCDEAMASPT